MRRGTTIIAGITVVGRLQGIKPEPGYLAGLFLVQAVKHPQRQA
jgi:hypothetical protein